MRIKLHFPEPFLFWEALLCNLWEQKIKQAMASTNIAPGALEGKYSQIYDLDRKDQMYIREDGT